MLDVESVSKTYQPTRGIWRLAVRNAATAPVVALDGVSLSVGTSEVVGLLGANGAGKSTLIKAITMLLTPDSGRIRFDGREIDAGDPRARGRFGLVLADDRSHYWRLSGRQNLEFFAALHGMDRRTARHRAGELLERYGLADRDRLVLAYSSGMRARLGVARALLHRPELLVLDEPTRSLDPVAAAGVCQDLRDLADDGRAVLVSSHRLDEITEISDRLVVLVSGRVRWSGRTADLGVGSGELRTHLTHLLDEGSGS